MSTAANSWPGPEKARTFREARLQIRLTEGEKRLYAQAAERQHLSISAWLRLASLQDARSRDRPTVGSTPVRGGLDLRRTQLQLRLTDEERRAFSEAAERRHLSVSAWLRWAAFRAARRERDRP
jgi:uncharacterized protein (DUF1778 family)